MKANDKVTGTYCGAAFSGVITEMRCLTVKTDGAFEFSIDLDSPIVVFGETRNQVLMFAKFDGSSSSYTKHQDSLAAA